MGPGTSGRTARVLAVILLIAAAAALAGCTTKVITAPSESATLDTVTSSGSGTALAAPDTAELSFSIVSTDGKAKAALDRASATADAVSSAVKKAGVDAADVQTADMRIDPNYTNPREGEAPKVASYQATIVLRVRVRDMEAVGEVIEAGTGAGANGVNGPTFTLEDDAGATAAAIEDAVEDARARAEAMAKAAGKSVGAALTIKETAVQVPEVYRGATGEAYALDKAAIAVEAGQLDITADITVVFELR